MTTPEKLRRLADRLSAQNPVAAIELRGAADDIEATIEQGRTEVVDVETTLGTQMTIRTQDEIVADLIRRAETLEHSARHAPHAKAQRIALRLAAHVLRVAAVANSRVPLQELPEPPPKLIVYDGGKK